MKSILPASTIFLSVDAFAQIPSPADALKALTPEQSAAAFKLLDGFRMEVCRHLGLGRVQSL